MDDSPENLVSLEAALEGLGQELVLARSGMEALRHLLEHDFAAILLDVKMPEMDGFQTAELIRARKRSRHTPILFLTGYKSDEHLFRGYDLGAVDFLVQADRPRNSALEGGRIRRAKPQYRAAATARPKC